MKTPNWKKVAAGAGGTGIVLLALVSYFEPAKDPTVPYRDVTEIPTNCSGNTHGVDISKKVTVDDCIAIDTANRKIALDELRRVVKTPLTRNQTDAFADLIYNVGVHTFTTSCNKGICRDSTLYKNLKAGNVTDACKNLLAYVYAGGKKLRGLIARRQAEYEICITKDPENVVKS